MECRIKDVSINYEIMGTGKPIIMIHGYHVDYRVMAGCMEPIFSNTDNYKRIYIDLPGMGKSGTAQWITNSDVLLDILVEFIERVIPDESFLLAGQSYGGYLTRGVLYKMADRVDGVLLICPVIIADNDKRTVPEPIVLYKDKDFLAQLTSVEAEAFDFVVQNEKSYNRFKNEIMSGIGLANGEFLKIIRKEGYAFSFDVDKLMKKFEKPSLILLGKQDDCVGYKDAWDILNNFTRGTFAIMDTAGHALQIEQEELFNSLVKEWLVRTSC